MGTHTRLGNADETGAVGADTTGCAYAAMPAELLQRVVKACVSWPEGRAGELEGVMRLPGTVTKYHSGGLGANFCVGLFNVTVTQQD